MTRAPWIRKPAIAKPNQLDPDLRRSVFARAGGRCECCAEPLTAGFQAHHRKLRSRGGQDSVCNLLALCPLCHRRVHGHVNWATDHGFIVSAVDDPAVVPVALHGISWRLLTTDGGYEERAA